MFFRFHSTHETIDFTLQESPENGRDDGALALRSNVRRVVVWIRQQLQQLYVQAVQQVAHELVGILLLVATERKSKWMEV